MDSYRGNLDPTNQGYTPADLVTQLDEYIVMRVTQAMIHNPAFAHSPTLDLEIDDVVSPYLPLASQAGEQALGELPEPPAGDK